MANIVKVDVEQLRGTSKRIGNMANQFEKEYQSVFMQMSSVGGDWQGADYAAFLSETAPFRDKFQHLTKTLRQYADLLSGSAGEYQSVQDQIIAQAKRI